MSTVVAATRVLYLWMGATIDRMATAGALREEDLSPGSVIATCLGAGVAAGLLVWFGLFPLAGALVRAIEGPWVDNGGFGLTVSAIGVAAVLAAMLAAVYWRYRHAAGGLELLRRLAVTLSLAVLLAIPVVTAYASSRHFATNLAVLVSETVISGCIVALAVVVAVAPAKHPAAPLD